VSWRWGCAENNDFKPPEIKSGCHVAGKKKPLNTKYKGLTEKFKKKLVYAYLLVKYKKNPPR
jgi:hypothetical protein